MVSSNNSDKKATDGSTGISQDLPGTIKKFEVTCYLCSNKDCNGYTTDTTKFGKQCATCKKAHRRNKGKYSVMAENPIQSS